MVRFLFEDMKQFTYTLDQLADLGRQILKNSPSKTLCFHGDMGAGKTTLIKAMVQQLSGEEIVSSPTFGIVNEYHYSDGQLLGYHFDFYRLEDETEALDLGLEDYLSSDAWVFMEWPEKITSYVPEDAVHLYITIIDERTREIQMKTS
ncbi:tRNA (adenosine(37)-N6)-threonylcarbamoyltransferase complex ATPase subunit type 1 TsaE [Spongiimicrobium salis]|uniref:tRNA (adenosine(37)-N6)-threonylcarbamoyltransferase complex ATPase subunit type 1 TsaE n=1 Tax=Spongiimicrobium salis TaxID=1667022 RepID=UPI00374DE066